MVISNSPANHSEANNGLGKARDCSHHWITKRHSRDVLKSCWETWFLEVNISWNPKGCGNFFNRYHFSGHGILVEANLVKIKPLLGFLRVSFSHPQNDLRQNCDLKIAVHLVGWGNSDLSKYAYFLFQERVVSPCQGERNQKYLYQLHKSEYFFCNKSL